MNSFLLAILACFLLHTYAVLRGKSRFERAVILGDHSIGKFNPATMLYLMDGRLILSRKLSNKNQGHEQSKQMRACTTSTGEVGICTRLSHCSGFRLSTIHNNLCFMDIFVPGICCIPGGYGTKPLFPGLPFTFFESPKTIENNRLVPTVNVNQSTNSKFVYPPNKDCGTHTIPSSRIIHGSQPPHGKWPWMAAVFTNFFGILRFNCGGTLISAQHILTGAHCVKRESGNTNHPLDMIVRLGDNDLNTTNDESINEYGRFFKIEEIIPHPEFHSINHYFLNDVAIIKLKEKVTFSHYIYPICLPPPSAENEPLNLFAGEISTVIGYGKNEKGEANGILMEAQVPVWKNHDCDKSYIAPITDIFICAGYKEGGMDACQGDSGGPLQIEVNKRWTQIGITSFGKGCGRPGYPGVYARIGKFIKWIKENIR